MAVYTNVGRRFTSLARYARHAIVAMRSTANAINMTTNNILARDRRRFSHSSIVQITLHA